MPYKQFKILLTADSVGGVWTYALELIKSWEHHNIEVALATMGAPLTTVQHQEISQFTHVSLFESTYKLEWMDNPWQEVETAGKWLLEINKTFKPDLIHLNNFCHGQLPWGKPVVMVVHSCVLSWWQAVKGNAAPSADWQTYKEKVTQGLQAADLVVAPSKAMLQEATKLYGPFQKSKVIYNGRDPQLFELKPKEPFIFSMGRIWDEGKNIGALAQVADQLDWPVYLAGEARHPVSGIQEELQNVHFLGQLSPAEVRDYLAKASIFVLPALYEPFGLSPLEGSLSGCALVLSNLDSFQEIWGDAATYVNPGNATELINTINGLIDDDIQRNMMGSQALRRGLQYNTQCMSDNYLQAYQDLVPTVDFAVRAPQVVI